MGEDHFRPKLPFIPRGCVLLNVLITGSSGFLGSRLAKHIDSQSDFVLTSAARRKGSAASGREILITTLDRDTDWSGAVAGQEVVMHAAGRAHRMDDGSAAGLAEYRKINVEGTLKLARQAAAAGVKRFVFISSIKVNGEHTDGRGPFTPEDMPAPVDAYGISKWEAEEGLKRIGYETGMEFVIIRPPLIYGPEVQGNFRRLLRLAKLPVPLPFGLVHNNRSMVYIDNLVDFIVRAICHPAAANQTFLVSDGVDISSTELLRTMRQILGRRVMLMPIPSSWLKAGFRLAGRGALAQRLFGSLQADISKCQRRLGWMPPYSVEHGLVDTINK